MLRWHRADLHIHSCLSPCSDLTMSPLRIVRKARAQSLDMIAICDHNSAENISASFKAAKKSRLTVFAGMEITSKEEVHIIAMFDRVDDALTLQGTVYTNLPRVENDPEVFGEQLIVNELDEVEGHNDRLLIGATELGISEIVDGIHRLNGLAIASHVDRPGFSIIGQLGFIPADIDLDALEISPRLKIKEAAARFEEIRGYPVITSSDAHKLDEIGSATTEFYLTEPVVAEIRKALMNEDGRTYRCGS